MHRSPLLGVLPCLALLAVVTATKEAQAGPYLGLDLDLGTAFQDRIDFSYGVGGRFGYKLYFEDAPLWLMPEIGAHLMRFDAVRSYGEFDHVGAVFGGVRFGFDGV